MNDHPADLPALGDPDDDQPDFAPEHERTTVGDDGDTSTGDKEPESPKGLGGMDIPGHPVDEL